MVQGHHGIQRKGDRARDINALLLLRKQEATKYALRLIDLCKYVILSYYIDEETEARESGKI